LVPVTIDPMNVSADISCTSDHFCMALDWAGNVMRYDGQTWTAPVSLGATPAFLTDKPEGIAISCGGPTLCAAITNTSVFTWDGSSWSTQGIPNPEATLSDVSCGTATTCRAIDAWGHVYTFTKP